MTNYKLKMSNEGVINYIKKYINLSFVIGHLTLNLERSERLT